MNKLIYFLTTTLGLFGSLTILSSSSTAQLNPSINVHDFQKQHWRNIKSELTVSSMNSTTFTQIISLPWGEKEGIPELLVSGPLTSLATPFQEKSEEIRAKVRLKVLNNLDLLLILVNDPIYGVNLTPKVLIFTREGKLLSQVEIPKPSGEYKTWKIVDIAADSDNIFLL